MNQDVSRSDPRSSYSQSERLVQIGSYLQQVREEQGLSVDQVATKTMISARHIRAIEVGDLGTLPEAIYVRGFIKRYAELLGLDGSEISVAFPLYSDNPTLKPTWQNSDVAQLRQTHLYLAYVSLITLAVIGLGAVLVRLDNGKRPGRSEQPSVSFETDASPQNTSSNPQGGSAGSADSEPAEASSDRPDSPSTSSTDVEAETDSEASDLTADLEPRRSDRSRFDGPELALTDKPVQVELELQERSWLRVTVDGQLDFEGVLPEGTQRVWAGDDNVLIRVGNAGGVLAAFNGSDAELMGEPGSVQEKRFSADEAESSSRD